MKWFLTVGAMASLIAGMTLDVMGHTGSLIVGFLAFCLLLCCANLDRIAEFQASAGSITAKTRDVVERAETAISELQVLACQVASLSLSLVQRQGRIGGYTDTEADHLLVSTVDVLKKLKVGDSKIEEALNDWHNIVEFDYGYAILGGSYVPEGDNKEARADWGKLRDGGIEGRPSPRDIESFLVKHDFMDDTLKELLIDYKHYIAYRKHRRPDVWKLRRTWPRLSPKPAPVL
jgi:hypothetical protein